jgi:hypothetical protein
MAKVRKEFTTETRRRGGRQSDTEKIGDIGVEGFPIASLSSARALRPLRVSMVRPPVRFAFSPEGFPLADIP